MSHEGPAPEVTMTFVSGNDDVKIAESIANHLKAPVVILRPDGTKNYVIPVETGKFETQAPIGSGDDDFEPHPGYSEFGG